MNALEKNIMFTFLICENKNSLIASPTSNLITSFVKFDIMTYNLGNWELSMMIF